MPLCHGAWHPSIDQLIQYCGVDFNIHARRDEFLAMFKCERCGRAYSTLTVASYPSGGYNAFYTPTGRWAEPDHYRPSERELAQRAIEAQRRKIEAERGARERTRFKEMARMEERAAKGVFDIGPPDPRKLWHWRPKTKR